MDLSKILEYQKRDSEIFKLERQLNNNENKKRLLKPKWSR